VEGVLLAWNWAVTVFTVAAEPLAENEQNVRNCRPRQGETNMCQIKNGELFRLKREKARMYANLFYKIRFFRDSSKTNKNHQLTYITNRVKRNIIAAIGRNELAFAKLIYRRAVKAGVQL